MSEGVVMTREKPRRPLIAITYRVYRLTRKLLPRRWLEARLLNAAWLSRRIALEQVGYARGGPEGLRLTRPHVGEEIRSAAQGAKRALDVGGGSGTFTPILSAVCDEVIYVDLDPANVERARALCSSLTNVELIQGDALAVAEQRGPFDLAVMLHVLEHLDEPVSALSRLRRHARSLLVEVPDFESDALNFPRVSAGLPVHTDDDHVVEFTADQLERVLTKAGWHQPLIRRRSGSLIATAAVDQAG